MLKVIDQHSDKIPDEKHHILTSRTTKLEEKFELVALYKHNMQIKELEDMQLVFTKY